MKHYVRILFFSTLVISSALAIAGCDEELIDDATFRLWCGNSLCSWKLDEGSVRQAPTWHKNDLGVELVDAPTTISQDLKGTAKCLAFTTIADVDPSAQVSVAIDFNGDGVIDWEQPIAATKFKESKTEVTSPRTAVATTPPRIFLKKKGTGRAVLAQIRLQGHSRCTAPPLRLKDLPLASACSHAADDKEPSECKSGVCCEGICAECCVKPNAFDFVRDGGSEFAVATPPTVLCAGDEVCERRDVKHFSFITETVPLQCNPGRNLRKTGAICLGDDDCESNSCEGASSTAFTPRGIGLDSEDAEARRCPSDFPDAGGREGCEFVRVQEGRCR